MVWCGGSLRGISGAGSGIILSLLIVSIALGFALNYRAQISSDISDSYGSIGVRVGYSPPGVLQSPGSAPEFIIIIKDQDGRPLKAIFSIYAWPPDGGFRELGIYGGVGVVRANHSVLRDFSREWRDYLASRNTDPRYVSPGIILMGAIHDEKGVYHSLRGVPIRIEDVLANKSVTIEIRENLKSKKPLIEVNQTNTSTQHNMGSQAIMPRAEQTQWPPEIIYYKDCCYVWKLEEVYANSSVGVPIVVAYLYGPHFDKIDRAMLRIYYQTTDVEKIVFGIAASVSNKYGEIASYEIPGYSYELKNNIVWINYYKDFNNGLEFSGPSIVGIGYYADMAVARYRLYHMTCDWTQCYLDWPTDVVSNMTMMRPVVNNTQLISWSGVDTSPYDGQGILENAFRSIRNNWAWSKPYKSQRSVFIDYQKVINDTFTLPALSASGAVAAILCYLAGPGAPVCVIAATIATIISASVGLEREVSTNVYEEAYIGFKTEYINQGYCIWANYFYSPNKLEYGGSSYYIGSLYVDALAYYDTSCPLG